MRIGKVVVLVIVVVVGLAFAGAAQSRLRIDHADNLTSQSDASGQSVERLTGNVRLIHDGTVMLCDVANRYSTDRITANGNVRVIRDGVTLTGEQLVYDAITRQGVVTGRVVKLVDDSTVLVTNSIKFDTKLNVAEYTTGGTITSPDGDLVSQYGYYYREQKKAVFKGSVVLKTGESVIKSDSLMYLVATQTAVFIAPTDVTTPKEHMTFNRGRYFRKSGLMIASGSVYLLDEHNREVLSDSIEYYRDNGLAKLFGNVQIADSARKNYLLGDFARFNRKPEEMFVTDNPVMISISEKSDSVYLRADTLMSVISFNALGDTIRSMIAYRNVRSYGKDMQSSCDSMFVSGIDSTVTMFYEPLIWSDITQISANELKFISKDKQLVRGEFIGDPFIAQRVDSISFNQIRGKTMTAFFAKNQITRLDAIGNGQTVYYMQDKEKVVAVNITESQNLSLYFADSKIKKISFRSKPDSRMMPLDKLNKDEAQLKGLNWRGSRRPQSKRDVTLRTIRSVGDVVTMPGIAVKQKSEVLTPKNVKDDNKKKQKK